jgi:hypothetical protein
MSGRYVLDGPWITYWTNEVTDAEGTAHTVMLLNAALRDTRTGTIYEDGAHAVDVHPQPEGWRRKVYKGETAWMNAERLARDVETALAFGRTVPTK